MKCSGAHFGWPGSGPGGFCQNGRSCFCPSPAVCIGHNSPLDTRLTALADAGSRGSPVSAVLPENGSVSNGKKFAIWRCLYPALALTFTDPKGDVKQDSREP